MKLIGWERLRDDLISFKTKEGTLFIQFANEFVARIAFSKTNELPKQSDIIVKDKLVNIKAELSDKDHEYLIKTAELSLRIAKESGKITYFDKNDTLIASQPENPFELKEKEIFKTVFDENATLETVESVDGLKVKNESFKTVFDRIAFEATVKFSPVENESLYGFGSHENETLNLRGKKEYIYQHNLKACVPVLVSSKGYGILFDCMSYMIFDDTKNTTSIFCDAVLALDYYFICGDIDKIISGYRNLTGKAPILPKWAFGYWQSKERYVSQDEILTISEEFRKRQIPLDAIVLDWQSWPDGLWGQKSFDQIRFPTPEKMTEELHKNNRKFMISIWPRFGQGGENHTEMSKMGYLYSDNTIYNAFLPEARDLYWKQANEGLFSKGIDAWWCDATEPIDSDWWGESRLPVQEAAVHNVNEVKKHIDDEKFNAYCFYHSKGIYENQRKTTDKKRVVNLTRSSFAGQQRFSTITWSGDIEATWETMYKQIPSGLNFSITGCPYWTFDIGAFFVQSLPNLWFWKGDYNGGCNDLGYRELYTRWLQLGAFMPTFRSHGTDTPREPWRFGEKGEMFYDSIVKYINLRYSLMPYIYSLAGAVYLEDFTIVRALIFDFKDEKAQNISDQFMFGKNILVCPVTKPMYYEKEGKEMKDSKKERVVYLPDDCDWYDFYTNKKYSGGQTLTVDAPIDVIPLFVPEGSIIPTVTPANSTAELDYSKMTLSIYEGKDAEFTLYDDEGDNYNYETGKYGTITMKWDNAKRILIMSELNGTYRKSLGNIEFDIVVIGSADRIKKVYYSGGNIESAF